MNWLSKHMNWLCRCQGLGVISKAEVKEMKLEDHCRYLVSYLFCWILFLSLAFLMLSDVIFSFRFVSFLDCFFCMYSIFFAVSLLFDVGLDWLSRFFILRYPCILFHSLFFSWTKDGRMCCVCDACVMHVCVCVHDRCSGVTDCMNFSAMIQ